MRPTLKLRFLPHCKRCGNDVPPPSHPSGTTKIYCSEVCKRAVRDALRKERHPRAVMVWAPRSCEFCGGDVPPKPRNTNHEKKYCSRACHTRAHTARRVAAIRQKYAVQPHKRDCKECGEAFAIPFRARFKVYCSEECRHDALLRRRRTRPKQPEKIFDEKWEEDFRLSRQRAALARLKVLFAAGVRA